MEVVGYVAGYVKGTFKLRSNHWSPSAFAHKCPAISANASLRPATATLARSQSASGQSVPIG